MSARVLHGVFDGFIKLKTSVLLISSDAEIVSRLFEVNETNYHLEQCIPKVIDLSPLSGKHSMASNGLYKEQKVGTSKQEF